MRIAVIGAGAVGGFFGGRLAHAGQDVRFLARGDHLRALRAGGLRVDSPLGDLRLQAVRASDDPAEIGAADLILVCVKAWQVPEVARTLGPMIGPDTFAVPLQNGVEATGQLEDALGAGRVLGGTCKIISQVVEPGHIAHTGVDPVIAVGEADGKASDRARRFRQLFRGTGVQVEIPADIQVAIWEKFLIMAAVSGIGALTRVPIGVFRGVPETRELVLQAIIEAAAVARARRIPLSEDAVGGTLAFVDRLPEDGTSSIQRDIMEGRPSEIGALTGAVVRLGREAGIPTPLNDFLYGCLLPMERAARQE